MSNSSHKSHSRQREEKAKFTKPTNSHKNRHILIYINLARSWYHACQNLTKSLVNCMHKMFCEKFSAPSSPISPSFLHVQNSQQTTSGKAVSSYSSSLPLSIPWSKSSRRNNCLNNSHVGHIQLLDGFAELMNLWCAIQKRFQSAHFKQILAKPWIHSTGTD